MTKFKGNESEKAFGGMDNQYPNICQKKSVSNRRFKNHGIASYPGKKGQHFKPSYDHRFYGAIIFSPCFHSGFYRDFTVEDGHLFNVLLSHTPGHSKTHTPMLFDYYTLPMNFEAVMHQRKHQRCSAAQSIVQHLHLILTTAFGEFSANEYFGCAIWEHDFDNLTNSSQMKEIIRQSLLKSIAQHENRLSELYIDLLLKQEELVDQIIGRRIKKRIDITITGMFTTTNETFHYQDSFFVGPLSY